MPFPTTPLDVRVDLGLAGVWTNVTADALVRDGITIARGRADEASQVDPGSCSLTLRNPTGKYSPRNPVGPYYGVLGRNTPLRVGIGVPPAGASTPGQTGTSIVAPSLTAETAGALFCVWAASPVGNITVPGGFTPGTERDGTFSTWAAGYKTVAAGATGTSTATHSLAATAATALSVFVPGAALSITGFTGAIATSGAAAAVSTSGITNGDYLLAIQGWSSDPGDSMVNVPVDPDGACRWILVADTGPSAGPRIKAYLRKVTGVSSLTAGLWGAFHETPDIYVRTWRITGATEWNQRFTGEVASWPTRWDLSGNDVWTPIQGAGILRRLGQGAAPLRSALRRELSSGSLKAYWPMEDAEGASSFASALGGPAMKYSGAPAIAADDGFVCSDPLPTFTNASARGVVPTYPATNQYSVGALFAIPTAGSNDEQMLLSIAGGGSITKWTIKLDLTGTPNFRIEAWDGDGVVLNGAGGTPCAPARSPLGQKFYLRFEVRQNGGNVDWTLWYSLIEPTRVDTEGFALFVAAQTVTRVYSVTVGAGGTTAATSTDVPLGGAPTVGHVAVSASASALFAGISSDLSLIAFNGEACGYRISRLCQEEGVPIYVALASATSKMGPQLPRTLLELLRECEAVDGGVLHEPRGLIGLAYRTRTTKQNQTEICTLHYPLGQIAAPLEPTDDDQRVVNDITVTRPSGSSARQTLDSGPLSTQPPPNGVGRYDTSIELNAFSDDDLADHAGWRLRIGTWDEARYPSVRVDLAAAPEVIDTATLLDVGDTLVLANLPAWVPARLASLIAEGFTERIGLMADWDIVANTTPSGSYWVAALDSPVYGRLDSATSTLAAGVSSSAATLSVAVATGSALWTTTATRPTDFPFGITVAGEDMTVTAIVGVASPQTFSVIRSINGVAKAQAAGAQVRLTRPAVLALTAAF